MTLSSRRTKEVLKSVPNSYLAYVFVGIEDFDRLHGEKSYEIKIDL